MLARSISQAVAGLAFLLLPPAADAGVFAVSPVRVALSAATPVASMTVRNDGAEATVVQLEPVAWSQKDGKDQFAQTREVLATPPIFTLNPGGSQIIRVGLRRAPDPHRELTYRLFLQEVPAPPRAGFQGLQVALRLSVPVFVRPGVPAAPMLQWQASRSGDGSVKVGATNVGTAHAQISRLNVSTSGGAAMGQLHVSTYVLPGERQEWIVKAPRTPSSGDSLRLSAQTDAGEMKADVVVGTR
jgi:fimbrial chaperone protein